MNCVKNNLEGESSKKKSPFWTLKKYFTTTPLKDFILWYNYTYTWPVYFANFVFEHRQITGHALWCRLDMEKLEKSRVSVLLDKKF